MATRDQHPGDEQRGLGSEIVASVAGGFAFVAGQKAASYMPSKKKKGGKKKK